VAVFDAHVAPIANEMAKRAGGIVHAIVIDAKHANVFRQGGETAGPAKQAIGRDGNRYGHVGTKFMLQGQDEAQAPPQSIPASSPFCTASMQVGAMQNPALHTLL
jgi:hypothetical protein